MKGYKGFNKDLTCREFQYEIGKEYICEGEIQLCENGFHFCKNIADVSSYYQIENENIRLCEIEAIGEIIEGDDKCVTNKIKIIKEIDKEEMYILGNVGKMNVGLGNKGDRNTGNRNTGSENTGSENTGDRNTGNKNTGDWNTGYMNEGDCNTGHYNTGDRNTGDNNTGNRNAGNRNTGDKNTGNRNTGDENTGNKNAGNRNTGDWNTGSKNTGDCNTGNWNTGDWNKTNRSSGIFCNEEPKLIMFNKQTNITWQEWKTSKAYYILSRNKKSKWIDYEEMTDEEKEKYPNAKISGGYLKEIKRKDSSQKWWNELNIDEKAEIIQLPNFDLDVFNDIMELSINKTEYKKILKYIEI